MTTDSPETTYVNTKRVSCDGGGGVLGHPRVWLEMGEKRSVECPYCDRVFVLSSAEGGSEEKTPTGGSQDSASA